MRDIKENKFLIISILVSSILTLGIAFATFATNLSINGNATVQSSNWEIVFEGLTNESVLDNPTTYGTAEEITHPTIKNNATEISNYSISLQTPGDSVTYNFKIHNKGDFSAGISDLTLAGVSKPSTPVSGAALVTDSSIAAENLNTLNNIEYKFYYTDNNVLVGQDEEKDCLAPDESENVTLKIIFSNTDETDTSVLPTTNLVLDNLGLSIIYEQGQTCAGTSSGGGNGGGNIGISDTSAPGSVETPIGRGTGAPVSAPTLNGEELDDAAGSISAAGDSIEFPIVVTPEDDAQVTAAIPTLQDLIAANPSIDPNILEDIEINVVNADTGEPITAVKKTCIEKDVPVRIKVILKYKDVPTKSTLSQATTVNVPTTKLTYKKVLTCTETVVPTYNNNGQYVLAGRPYYGNLIDLVYTQNLSDISTNLFLKNINGNISPCYNVNGNVYCLTDDDNETSLRSLCSTLGGTYSHTTNEGSTNDEVVSRCIVNNGIGFIYYYNFGCEHAGPQYGFGNYEFNSYYGDYNWLPTCTGGTIGSTSDGCITGYDIFKHQECNTGTYNVCNVSNNNKKYEYFGQLSGITDFCAEHSN